MRGRTVNPGRARGEALVSRTPLSFYGGVDPKTGVVVERGHELQGKSVAGKILVFPRGKGSTVGSYVIYALKKNGVAPLAVVNEETEPIVAAGVILADIPCVDRVDLSPLETGDLVEVDADRGRVEVLRKHGRPQGF
jgi:predicted aconitase with swiveling domain